jgi:hypothetical protein
MTLAIQPAPDALRDAPPDRATEYHPQQLAHGAAEAEAWRARAAELAHWAWGLLVNRTDVWGGYYRTRDDVGNWVTCQTTHPKKADRGKRLLTHEVLARHFRATCTRDVIGLHTTAPANTCRWGALDLDRHGDGGPARETTLAAALHWYGRLRSVGLMPLLSDSNGRGGFHLLTIFSQPVATERVFDFLHWLTPDHAEDGLPTRPESFPKQPKIDLGRFGNWLRLPGRHHTRDHWSRVWDGGRWLEGAAAVDFILGLGGSPPVLIPANALGAATRRAASPRQNSHVSRPVGALANRARAYLDRLPSGLAEGQHRDDIAYTYGAFLVRDLHFPDPVALAWLNEWDRRNTAPKGEERLKEILANVHLYGRHAYGSGRNDGVLFAEV